MTARSIHGCSLPCRILPPVTTQNCFIRPVRAAHRHPRHSRWSICRRTKGQLAWMSIGGGVGRARAVRRPRSGTKSAEGEAGVVSGPRACRYPPIRSKEARDLYMRGTWGTVGIRLDGWESVKPRMAGQEEGRRRREEYFRTTSG